MIKAKKKRFRDYGLNPWILTPGRRNMITDVGRVKVGHRTIIKGDDIRTGVTIIDPGVPKLFRKKIPAAIAVGNGFGKLTGITQVEETGLLEAPIALTNTLAVGPVMRGIIDIVLKENPKIKPTESVNVVVGEVNDGFLNNLHKDIITKEDVKKAYANRSKLVKMGNVGAGTGTKCFAWKGGIGTASRVIRVGGKLYVLGGLVQTNYGGSLVIAGVPVGRILKKNSLKSLAGFGGGSCMIVLATDAPVGADTLKRIAKRSFLGLGRTGSIMANQSGDYAIAFSISREKRSLPTDLINLLFLAAVEVVEESVYEALFAAETMRGRDQNVLEALPISKILKLLKK